MLTALFDALGYQVLTATNGKQALDHFHAHQEIALLISDVVMPVMGGCHLVKQIRAQAPTMPVLFMTGHTFDSDISSLLKSPATKLIEKPFSLADITKMVRTLLGKDRLE